MDDLQHVTDDHCQDNICGKQTWLSRDILHLRERYKERLEESSVGRNTRREIQESCLIGGLGNNPIDLVNPSFGELIARLSKTDMRIAAPHVCNHQSSYSHHCIYRTLLEEDYAGGRTHVADTCNERQSSPILS